MAVFHTTEELYDVMDDLWTWIKSNEIIAAKLLQSRLVVRFHYRNPDGMMTVDGSDGQELKYTFGECDAQPTVQMYMDSDLAHRFWLGKVNIPAALISGELVSKGPVNKALALVPAVRPAHKIYPAIAARRGKAA